MRPIVVDGGEEKKKLSLELGAEAFVDFREHQDPAEKVKEICDGIGAHGVLVTAYQAYKSKSLTSTLLASLTNSARTDSWSFIGDRRGGRIMCIALPPAGTNHMTNEPSFFIFRNLHVIGTLVGTMQDTAAALEYAKRGLLKPISEVRGMSKFAESVEQLRRGEVAGRIVIDFNKD